MRLGFQMEGRGIYSRCPDSSNVPFPLDNSALSVWRPLLFAQSTNMKLFSGLGVLLCAAWATFVNATVINAPAVVPGKVRLSHSRPQQVSLFQREVVALRRDWDDTRRVDDALLDGNNVTLSRRTGTEVVTCYGFGTSITRDSAIPVIDDWCNNIVIGQFVPAGATLWARYDYGSFTIYLSALALTSCQGFTIDANCNRLLRLPLDGCNTNTVTAKQGGYETDACGQWRFDPGSNGSDV
ncbi:hypothetical protein D9613_004018 [Agrocybe pediades]|uniref:Uncharacterized protein n=1 Tax=Agrocybe pediades TaxID=84607 RepID=A0A8H4QJP3_9AGAR|nr:hypothetical protein D9613_004018 [Agrocybe pediades]